jgi:hypothetical protein
VSGVRGRPAWALFASTVALAFVQVVLLARSATPLFSGEFSDDGFPLVTVAAVAASAVGLMIVDRHPRHRIGWLFLVGQAGTMLGLALQAYGFTSLVDGFGPRPLAHVALWGSVLLGSVFALTLVALLLLLVPDGHLLSRRSRWAAWSALAGLAVHDGAVVVLVPPGRVDAESHVAHAPAVLPFLSLLGALGVFVGLVGGVWSLVVQLRRSSGDRREQLRWIAAAAAALAASVPAAVLLGVVAPDRPWLGTLPLMLAYLALPLCTGLAILRHRLFDVDLIVNRSISLAVLTAFVTAGYVALVVVLGRLGGGGSLRTSLVASVVVAVAVQPLRRRVTALADRLVYGAQAVPYEALADFTEELRHGTSYVDLLPRVAEATARSLPARRVRVWVEPEAADASGDGVSWTAVWPDASAGRSAPQLGAAAPEVSFPVLHDGEPLGGLAVTMPPGRGLRRTERRLLTGFTDQLGAAFRACRLEARLASQVRLLTSRREQLERSRLRLVTAQSAERLRFESAIASEVLPHLATMPDELAVLAARPGASDAPWPSEEVERLIVRVGAALDALRRLTRGVFPAQLVRRGLAPALGAHLEQTGVPHELTVEGDAGRRFDARVESVVYFCTVELVRSLAGPARVRLVLSGDRIAVTVTGPPGSTGADTEHVVDRAEAIGGVVHRERLAGRARVVVEVPVRPPVGSPAVGQPDRLQRLGAEG